MSEEKARVGLAFNHLRNVEKELHDPRGPSRRAMEARVAEVRRELMAVWEEME